MIKKRLQYLILIVLAWNMLSSCAVYRQHYMFQADEDDLTMLSTEILRLERTYIIQPYDVLELQVFTNGGERLIDPNYELRIGNNSNAMNQQGRYADEEYLVLSDGRVKIPMLGYQKLDGLSIDVAEEYLEEKYKEYYKEPYVKLKYTNKRVIVLGALGGQLVPLQNEKVSLIEVLALAGGIEEGGKAQNIRIVRGDLRKPEVFMVDLNTIKGMKDSIIPLQPGDIVYVEPRKKILSETVRDVATILTLATNIVAIYVLVTNIK